MTKKLSVKQLKELARFTAQSGTGKVATFEVKGDVAVDLNTGKEVKLDSIRRSWEVIVEEVQAEETVVAEVVVEEDAQEVAEITIGSKVKLVDGTIGKVIDIVGTLATVETKDDEVAVKIDALELVEQDAEITESASALPKVTELEAKVFNKLNELLAPYEEDFSDVDVTDLANATELSVNKVKGVVGSLTKKGFIFTYNTDSVCMNTGKAIDFDLICRYEDFRDVVLEASKGAKLEKAEKTVVASTDNKEVAQDDKYKYETVSGEGWTYSRKTDLKGNFCDATLTVNGEVIMMPNTAKTKMTSKKYVKQYLAEKLNIISNLK